MTEKAAMKGGKKVRLTYVGPCDLFYDEVTGLFWKRGETLVVELKVAERLLSFNTKFKSSKAEEDEQLTSPEVSNKEDVVITPGFEVS